MKRFKKSSFSGYDNFKTQCVEVALEEDKVSVRHSMGEGPEIEYTVAEWDAFVKGVKAGEFDT